MSIKTITTWGLFLIILVASIYLFSQRASLLMNSTLEQGAIVACDYKQASGRGKHRHNRQYRIPIAATESGAQVKGKYWSTFKCSKLVGRSVSAFVHNSNPEKSFINLIGEFWLLPAICFYGLLATGLSLLS